MPLKIAIIGAGPSGCTLARLLQQSPHPIAVTIFESEATINFRSQGGTLDLHTHTGQAAMKAAGLYEEFLKHARFDGEAMTLCDKNLLAYIKQGGSTKGSSTGTGRPEIDRPKLREVLYYSLREGTVEWSHKLMHVDGDCTLHFANGTSRTGFDLVVGADGAWSKVAPAISSEMPFYSGIAGHALRIPDVERHAELFKLLNRGSVFAFSDGKSIMAQYMGDGSANVGTWCVRSANWRDECGYDVHDGGAVKAACLKDFEGWDVRLLAFTQVAEDHVTPRDLYMLPIGERRWKHSRGVTLIGDASHVATPFAGEGVNLAMADSLKLAEAIIDAATKSQDEQTEALDKNVAAFEQDMFRRAEKMQQMTYDMMHAMYLEPGAPRKNIEKYVIRAVGGEMPWFLEAFVLTPIVYAWFFVFKMIW